MIFASKCVRIRQDIKDTCCLRQSTSVNNFTSQDLRYVEGGARILRRLHLFFGEDASKRDETRRKGSELASLSG